MREVRVGVVVASREGAWVRPVPSDGLDAGAWYETFVGHTLEGLDEFALRVARQIVTPEIDDSDLYDLGLLELDRDTPPLAVFLGLTDVPDAEPDAALRRLGREDIAYLQRNTTDPALAIALRQLEILGLRGDSRSPWGPERTMPTASGALALLHERLSDDTTTWTATYRCEVSGDGVVVRGPSAATPAEALAWGRDRAATVLLFVGDRPGAPYNAGTEHETDPGTGDPWPTVPEPFELAPRTASAADHVRYEPLFPVDTHEA